MGVRKRPLSYIRMVPEKDVWLTGHRGRKLVTKLVFKRGEPIWIIDERGTNRGHWGYFRRMVFKRDNYTCQECGEKKDIRELRAHHRKPVELFPNLYYDIDNAVTLCIECHKNVHRGA